jgi:hypothetical protein
MAHTTATHVDIHRLFNTQVHDRQGEAFAHIANVWTDGSSRWSIVLLRHNLMKRKRKKDDGARG